MRRPPEKLQYAIEEWASDDSRMIEVLARAGSLSVAYAAYWAALAAKPGAGSSCANEPSNWRRACLSGRIDEMMGTKPAGLVI
jgi:hypothetical protein